MARKLIAALSAFMLACGLMPVAAFAQPISDEAYAAAVKALAAEAQESWEAEKAKTFVNAHGYVQRIEQPQEENAAAPRAAMDLPVRYTAPYTSVKNQGITESCWAFASIASAESSYLVQHRITDAASDAVDFSEAQVVYGSFNGKTEDGKPGTAEVEESWNDHLSAVDGLYGFLTRGSWENVATALAAGRGVSYESDIPFASSDSYSGILEDATDMAQAAAANYDLSRFSLDRAVAVGVSAPVEEGPVGSRKLVRQWEADATTQIKEAIYGTGAVFVLMHMASYSGSPYYHMDPREERAASEEVLYARYPNYWAFDADKAQDGDWIGLSTNHAVTIVGWDDEYSRWNFATPLYDEEGKPRAYDCEDIACVEKLDDGTEWIVPVEDGAWLVKNSWGTGDSETGLMGDEGMFYVSYCEKTFDNAASFVFSDAEEDQPKYEIVHQYDATQPTTYGYYESPVTTGANVFHVDGAERLGAIGMWVPAQNSEIDIAVYTGLAHESDPESGDCVLRQHESVSARGWYTFDLSSEVDIEAGSAYSVVVSCCWGEDNTYVPVEMDNSWDGAVIRSDKGESFLKTEVEGTPTWVDTKDIDNVLQEATLGNVCVKAFANSVTDPKPDPDPGPSPDPGEDSGQEPGAGSDPGSDSGSDEGSETDSGTADDSSANENAAGASPERLAGTGDSLPLAPVALCAVVAVAVAAAALRKSRCR